MIVIEYDNYNELINQHDHALLSGEMALRAGNPPFMRSDLRTVLTASLHDASWTKSDSSFQSAPYHFVDYPMSGKLDIYKTGIDDMEKVDKYVALLTSLHYTAFFSQNGPEETRNFLRNEEKRQQRLRSLFPNDDISLAHEQLKMWDNFSLYVCLNKPGVRKEDEHPWFKNGIKAVSAAGESILVKCNWKDERTVAFSPYPFIEPWTASIPVAVYSKDHEFLERKQRHVTFVES